MVAAGSQNMNNYRDCEASLYKYTRVYCTIAPPLRSIHREVQIEKFRQLSILAVWLWPFEGDLGQNPALLGFFTSQNVLIFSPPFCVLRFIAGSMTANLFQCN